MLVEIKDIHAALTLEEELSCPAELLEAAEAAGGEGLDSLRAKTSVVKVGCRVLRFYLKP